MSIFKALLFEGEYNIPLKMSQPCMSDFKLDLFVGTF